METVRSTCDLARTHVNDLLAGREPWKVVAGTAGVTLSVVWLWGQLHHEDGVSDRLKKRLFRLLRMVPAVRRKIQETTVRMNAEIIANMSRMNEGMPYVRELPAHGLDSERVLERIREYCAIGKYSRGELLLSGTVYHGGDELTRLMTDVYAATAWSNPLHPDVFPGVRKMEAEVTRMCCDLFHGGPESCGSVTSGGTESIIMAMKACRDMAREERGISRPQVLVPVTAHAAFDKGAHLLRMKLTHVPVDPVTSRVDVRQMRRMITSNTVMLVCSAPAFPHGNIDPIEDVAALGVRYNIPVHVDSCLGGFLVPFMADAGYPVVPFDFRVRGVTSISADTHKYGFAPKGSSMVMYSSENLRHYQFFVQPDWPGGIYACPTMAGSRSGAVIAGCWATMVYYGRDGYVETTRKIIHTTRYIERECRKISGLRVQGACDVSVVAIASDEFNIYRLSDAMEKNGWSLNALQKPPSFHVAVTYCLTAPGVKEKMVRDLRQLTAEIMQTPERDSNSGHVALYGMSAGVPDRGLVAELAWCFLDGTYTTVDVPDQREPDQREPDQRESDQRELPSQTPRPTGGLSQKPAASGGAALPSDPQANGTETDSTDRPRGLSNGLPSGQTSGQTVGLSSGLPSGQTSGLPSGQTGGQTGGQLNGH